MKTVKKPTFGRVGVLCAFVLGISTIACQPESVQPKSAPRMATVVDSISVNNALPPKDVSGGHD